LRECGLLGPHLLGGAGKAAKRCDLKETLKLAEGDVHINS
jgi:hypothetical protein